MLPSSMAGECWPALTICGCFQWSALDTLKGLRARDASLFEMSVSSLHVRLYQEVESREPLREYRPGALELENHPSWYSSEKTGWILGVKEQDFRLMEKNWMLNGYQMEILIGYWRGSKKSFSQLSIPALGSFRGMEESPWPCVNTG